MLFSRSLTTKKSRSASLFALSLISTSCVVTAAAGCVMGDASKSSSKTDPTAANDSPADDVVSNPTCESGIREIGKDEYPTVDLGGRFVTIPEQVGSISYYYGPSLDKGPKAVVAGDYLVVCVATQGREGRVYITVKEGFSPQQAHRWFPHTPKDTDASACEFLGKRGIRNTSGGNGNSSCGLFKVK